MKTELTQHLYNNPTSNSTRKPAPQLLEQRSIPTGMQLARQIGCKTAALILQHFFYLLIEGYGKNIDGERWLWNPRWKWVEDYFFCLSEWEFRKAINHLKQLELLKTCQHRAKEWNHTNYYTLNYDRLKALMLSIGEPTPIDWRPLTNRLVTAHQSNKEAEQTAKLLSSSNQSALSHPNAFPPQTGEISTGVTPCKGAPNVAALRADPCIEPPPPCSQNSSHGGGMLIATPLEAPEAPVVEFESSIEVDDDSAPTPLKSEEKPYSRVQLEALHRLGVLLNSAMVSQLRKAKSEQIDNAIVCFQEDKQSWAKNKPMNNPTGFFTKVLKQVVREGRSPLLKSDPLAETLEMWRNRWQNLPDSRKAMLKEIQANFPNGEIVVRNWEEGPIAGYSCTS